MQQLLYVDDDESIREVAALSLELDGRFKVRLAASGKEALAMLASGYRPDAVLLDVMMPDLDGPQTLARMRTQGLEELTVIFVTARSLDTERQALLSLGACGIITKPFDPLHLGKEVSQILGKKVSA